MSPPHRVTHRPFAWKVDLRLGGGAAVASFVTRKEATLKLTHQGVWNSENLRKSWLPC